MKHAEYIEAIKKSAISTGKKVLISYLSKKLPFLFIPVVGPVVGLLIEKLVTILVTETEFGAFFLYIDFRVDAQGRAFSEAAIRNHKAQLSGDKNEIVKAEKELIERFRAFAILGS